MNNINLIGFKISQKANLKPTSFCGQSENNIMPQLISRQPTKDIVCFSGDVNDGCYDPSKPKLPHLQKSDSNQVQAPPNIEEIKGIMKSRGVVYRTYPLDEILNGTTSWREKNGDIVLQEVNEAIETSGSQTNLDKMQKIVDRDMCAYLYNPKGNGAQNTYKPADWAKCKALCEVIKYSPEAQADPAPWIVILKHLMFDKTVHNDTAVRIEAAEALCAIGNSSEHIKIFEELEQIHNYAPINGIASAGKNIIQKRIEAANVSPDSI